MKSSKYPFQEIVIIFNPNSSGDSEKNAKELKVLLQKQLKKVKITVIPTKRAGHAMEIAASYIDAKNPTLLLSSSGDGGYNEVVNGILKRPAPHVTVGVIPSGNANDHYHATANEEMAARILRGKVHKLDVLKVAGVNQDKPWYRYAHSYIGLGLTAHIGEKLTEAELNPVNEKWLVAKYLLRFNSVCLRFRGNKTWQWYSSVIFSTIDRMSKVIQLSSNAKVNDGSFEVYITPKRSVFAMIRILLKGTISGLAPARRSSKIIFYAKKHTKIQCDGEVFAIDGGRKTTVSVYRRRLRTLA